VGPAKGGVDSWDEEEDQDTERSIQRRSDPLVLNFEISDVKSVHSAAPAPPKAAVVTEVDKSQSIYKTAISSSH
jgi:hypothetical protein